MLLEERQIYTAAVKAVNHAMERPKLSATPKMCMAIYPTRRDGVLYICILVILIFLLFHVVLD
jgi:hypothetical protein